MRPDRDLIVTIDIGGTKMAAGLMTLRGDLVDREQVAVDHALNDSELFESLMGIVGDMTTRARNIIAAGLDLVLHCHGIMEEMKAVADVVPVLAGESLRRARAAEAAFRAPDCASEVDLRAEFNALFATV